MGLGVDAVVVIVVFWGLSEHIVVVAYDGLVVGQSKVRGLGWIVCMRLGSLNSHWSSRKLELVGGDEGVWLCSGQLGLSRGATRPIDDARDERQEGKAAYSNGDGNYLRGTQGRAAGRSR